MSEKISPEEFEAAQQIAKKVRDEIEREEEEAKKKPPEPITQKLSFDPVGDLEKRVSDLEKEKGQ